MPSYTRKQMRATLILADGNNTKFPGTNNNTLILAGLRMSATSLQAASLSTNMDLKIYGMRPQDMNALTVTFFGSTGAIPRNAVIVETNDGTGWTQFFSGTIMQAQPEYRGSPDAYFHLQARVGYDVQVASAKPLSYPGDANAADIVETIAGLMGFAFKNHGVTAQIAKGAYFPGTLYDQLTAVCTAARIVFFVHNNQIDIMPINAGTDNPEVILAPTSGLVNYPVIEQGGLILNVLYNPAIQGGTRLVVKNTDIPAANANWNPIQLLHALESELPGGAWFSEIHCVPFVVGGAAA